MTLVELSALLFVPVGFIIPILTAAATAFGGGIAQRLLGGVTNPSPVPSISSSAIQPWVPAPVPMTRAEMERRQAASRLYGTQRPNVLGDTLQRIDGGGGFYLPRRRMNVLNPRALNRSIRRVKGFAKFAKRVGSFTDPGKAYRLKGFGRKRSRR